MSKLHIYTASAGAGKTHTITHTFLRLALEYEQAFTHLQAVTFTNKATDEMRDRFLWELHVLATDPYHSAYLSDLSKELSIQPQEVQQKAEKTLAKILFDYTHLRVMTIDSFFQEVVRALALELGMPGNMRVELSTDQYLEEAIDQIFINPSKDAFRYMDRMLQEEGADWIDLSTLRKKLRDVGRNLEKEEVQKMIIEHTFPSMESIEKLSQAIQKAIKSIETKLRALWSNMQNHYQTSADLEKSLKRNTSMTKWMTSDESKFIKDGLTDKQLLAYPEQASLSDTELDAKFFKTSSTNTLRAVSLWRDSMKAYVEIRPPYDTLLVMKENLHALALMDEIHRGIERIRQEREVIFLEKSKQLVKRIVAEGEIPFIYEKIGVNIHHHMMDEFQDTSRFQYDNFRPLLDETLSNGHENMIVGDVKQSIYRFRNSDPMILHRDLSADFPPYADPRRLEYNWRSAPAIVTFNNQLFPPLAQAVDEYLTQKSKDCGVSLHPDEANLCQKVYQGVKQSIPEKNLSRPGGVFFHRVESLEEGVAIKTDEFRSSVARHIPQLLVELLRRGYQPGDIAILGYTARELRGVAMEIMHFRNQRRDIPETQRLEFVSEDLLSVYKSLAFRGVVAILRAVVALRNKNLERHQFLLSLAKEIENQVQDSSVGADPVPLDQFVEELSHETSYRSLYALVKKSVARIARLVSDNEIPYLVSLLDLSHDYAKDQVADLDGFLDWVEKNLTQFKLPYEAQNAIHLLTIHKSKGLGFPVVLLLSVGKGTAPFDAPWRWCSTDKVGSVCPSIEPLLPVKLPIRSNETARKTPFADEILREERADELDDLNTLYVACTRAQEELHLWKNNSSKKSSSASILSAFWEEVKNNDYPLTPYQEIKVGNIQITSTLYTYEENPIRRTGETGSEMDASLSGNLMIEKKHLATSGISKLIAIKRYSTQAYRNSEEIFRGEQWHSILSRILYRDDLDWSLRKAQTDGWIDARERDELRQYFSELLNQEELKAWYQPSSEWQVLNERRIVSERTLCRPDRILIDEENHRAVVIDYKTGLQENKHKEQIRRYARALNDAGYSVEGYLLYLRPQPQDFEKIRVN